MPLLKKQYLDHIAKQFYVTRRQHIGRRTLNLTWLLIFSLLLYIPLYAHRKEYNYSGFPGMQGVSPEYVSSLNYTGYAVHAQVNLLIQTDVGLGEKTKIYLKLKSLNTPIRLFEPYFVFEYHVKTAKVYHIYCPFDLPVPVASANIIVEKLKLEDEFRIYTVTANTLPLKGNAAGPLNKKPLILKSTLKTK